MMLDSEHHIKSIAQSVVDIFLKTCIRCHDSTNNRDRSVTDTPITNTAVTVAAPVMAQQSPSKSQSNSASREKRKKDRKKTEILEKTQT
jgi:hypothetical protein